MVNSISKRVRIIRLKEGFGYNLNANMNHNKHFIFQEHDKTFVSVRNAVKF